LPAVAREVTEPAHLRRRLRWATFVWKSERRLEK
jgi:hypothetical protein